MSGPATRPDVALGGPDLHVSGPADVDLTDSREAQVGAFRVRRALPRRARRSIGAWCFIDHMGPAEVSEDHGLDIGPHPHMGLQTVTWLVEGEALHRDSLGSEQVIRPDQLNLMTAGHGVSHSEEATGRYSGGLHGVQLWVAQPDATRNAAAAFEHHDELPRVELSAGTATVLIGELDAAVSPARRDTDHAGIDLDLRAGTTVVARRRDYEYGLVVLSGAVAIGDCTVTPGHLAFLGTGGDEIPLVAAAPSRALLVGGVPLDAPLLMWWNFVARTRGEIIDAQRAWRADDGRFGRVDSPLGRITVGPPPWSGP